MTTFLGFCFAVIGLLSVSSQAQSTDVGLQAFFVDDQGNRLADTTLTTAALLPVPGQRITLAVELYTQTWFSTAPKFPELNIADTISLKSQGFAINYTIKKDGESYAAQRREYTLFPQRVGQYAIDGIEVEVRVANSEGKPGGRQNLRSNPLLLQVAVLSPPQSLSYDQVTVASAVTLQQSWSSDLSMLRVGDVLERKVMINAESTLAMLIAPLTWPVVNGLKQSPGVTELQDSRQRGQFNGTRIETRFYTVQRSGQWQLPALTVDWWNVDEQQWQQSQFPEQQLQVAGGGGILNANGLPVNVPLAGWLVWWPWLAALLVSLVIIFGISPRLRLHLQRWRSSEAARYSRLRRALRRRQAKTTVRCYYHWRSHQSLCRLSASVQLQTLLAELYVLACAETMLTRSFMQQLELAIQQQRTSALTPQSMGNKSLKSLTAINPDFNSVFNPDS